MKTSYFSVFSFVLFLIAIIIIIKTQEKQVSAAVCSFTKGKCGLLPQHFHYGVNVAVTVVLLFFYIFCLQLCAGGLKN